MLLGLLVIYNSIPQSEYDSGKNLLEDWSH